MIRLLKNQVLFLLIFLVFAIPASASTLARLDSLRVAALEREGMETVTNQMPLVRANSAVNVSIQWVSANFPAVEKAGSITCSDGVASYVISDTTFRALTWCRIWRKHPPTGAQNLAVLKVVPVADSVYEYVQEGKSLPETDAPLAYAYAWAGSLYVSPAPNYEDTLKYGYCAIGRFLSGDTATTDIHPKYRELIVERAAYLIREELGLGKVGE